MPFVNDPSPLKCLAMKYNCQPPHNQAQAAAFSAHLLAVATSAKLTHNHNYLIVGSSA